MKYAILGGTIVSPEFIIQGAAITVQNDIITKIGPVEDKLDFQINLSPQDLVFPGLINGHDHLLGTYYPRIGSGPYMNWLPWDNDLKSHDLYQERSLIPNSDLYMLGSYRNLVSGVTTVSDHMPHSVNEDLIDKMPIRVIRNYSLEHEVSSYDLRWGRGITTEHQEAIDKDIPFITHIEEGFDEEAMLGVPILNEMKVLDNHCVLIHGIAFSEEDIDLLAEKQANVVWCPTSNVYMFKETTNIRSLLKKGVNVSLGTDSPMSGGMNILEELQFAHTLYKDMYHEELDYKTLVNMVTVNPAKALKLKNLGKIEIGYTADLLIIRDGNTQNPYQSLVNAWFDSIDMVIKDGVPVYGYPRSMDLFKKFSQHYQLLEINGKERVIFGKPMDLYKRIWNNVKYKKILPFLPVNSY